VDSLRLRTPAIRGNYKDSYDVLVIAEGRKLLYLIFILTDIQLILKTGVEHLAKLIFLVTDI
jgi:hypothetical protein